MAMATVEDLIEELRKDVKRLEDKVDKVSEKVALLEGQHNMTELLVKWVIMPLVVILGALVGVKLAWPG